MITPVSTYDYLKKLRHLPIVDVRAPAEYANGHIPGAINVPLFSDEERAIVGTIYKREGRESAVRRGFEIVAPHITRFIDIVQASTGSKELVIHCARGGMRSKSIAMMLDFSGYTVHLLTGGFKAYKEYLRTRVYDFKKLILIGGKTGSGKTEILRELELLGEQVIDLEGMARHRGSALGSLGQPTQPTQEQFIVDCFSRIALFDPSRPIWLEQEGCRLGNVQVPHELYQLMMIAPVVRIELSAAYRAKRLMAEYGIFTGEEMRPCIELMENRLGSEATKKVLSLLEVGDKHGALVILLSYYDRAYTHSMERNTSNTFHCLDLADTAPSDHAAYIRDSVFAQNIWG